MDVAYSTFFCIDESEEPTFFFSLDSGFLSWRVFHNSLLASLLEGPPAESGGGNHEHGSVPECDRFLTEGG